MCIVAGVLLKTAQRFHITPHRCTGLSIRGASSLQQKRRKRRSSTDQWIGLHADALLMAWLRGLAQDNTAYPLFSVLSHTIAVFPLLSNLSSFFFFFFFLISYHGKKIASILLLPLPQALLHGLASQVFYLSVSYFFLFCYIFLLHGLLEPIFLVSSIDAAHFCKRKDRDST
ncbi:hypothetical protein KFK09_003796 [Dendrobium nobile]|uniref:Uncharacterized protein n=1 Tax=Dendrobium nobile TaxID=94219 RepID=A0A8T3C407_DENNO|nr:hypothetical protein KFK09_003796 [Dendrobium nobile]